MPEIRVTDVVRRTRPEQKRAAKKVKHHFTPTNRPLLAVNHADPARPYVTLCPIGYSNGIVWLEIDKGFTCDLASVPFVGWALIWLVMFLLRALTFGWSAKPIMGATDKRVRMGLIHDAMYALQLVDRAVADVLFRTGLKQDGTPCWVAWTMYWFVRAFGWIPWRRYAAAKRRETAEKQTNPSIEG